MNPFPTTKELKLSARHSMAGAFGTCLRAAFLLTLAGFLLSELIARAGGAISLYYWDTAGSDIESSLSLSAAGLFAALRVEEVGMGLSIAITPAMLLKVLGFQLLAAALIAPLRLGCHERMWAVRRGEPNAARSLFAAYADLRRSGQAVLLEVILTAVQLLLQILFALPAVGLLRDLGATLEGFSAASWLLMLGMAFAWCLMTPFLPARFLLAREDSATALGALRGSLVRMRSGAGRFLRLRLSFAVWEICSALSNGVLDLYLFPYRALAAVAWLEAWEQAARGDL